MSRNTTSPVDVFREAFNTAFQQVMDSDQDDFVLDTQLDLDGLTSAEIPVMVAAYRTGIDLGVQWAGAQLGVEVESATPGVEVYVRENEG